MPRLKTKEQRKMLKLATLSDLSKVLPVPDEAFAPDTALDVPKNAFDQPLRKGYSPAPAYVRYKKVGKHEYAIFNFTHKLLMASFKGMTKETRLELVQGKAPHKDWFLLRIAPIGKGNLVSPGGINFSTKEYFKINKLEEDKAYVLETVKKDGNLYFKLPSELVPALA
jgi:hypothetical protein